MGGSAFSADLPQEAFPRLPPAIYQALKATVLPKLLELYSRVSVPTEAPEKTSYGDLDLLVVGPRTQNHPQEEEPTFISHDVVQDALGAKHVIPQHGNRTSNYAVPIQIGEWASFGHADEEEVNRRNAPNGLIFYQVDVHVCHDRAEFDRVNFFHAYGDMGMMLGLVARHIGLRLGEHGLKIPDPPYPHVELSASFDEILAFLALSKDVFDAGFQTKTEVFRWVASMKYFNPRYFKAVGPGTKKVKADRTMYAEFVEWVSTQPVSTWTQGVETENLMHQTVKEEALRHFGKKEQHEARLNARNNKSQFRTVFSGHVVRDWADLGEYWRGVKLIIDRVRKQLGGEDGVLRFYETHGEEELKKLVIQVRDELGLLPVGIATTAVTAPSI